MVVMVVAVVVQSGIGGPRHSANAVAPAKSSDVGVIFKKIE